MAFGLGASVTVLDTNLDRLREIDDLFHGSVRTLASNEYNLRATLKRADLFIGAVLIPGRSAPKLVSREMLKLMKEGAVIVDTRPAMQFAVAHIPGSVHIALTGQFASWAARILGLDRPLIIAAEEFLHQSCQLCLSCRDFRHCLPADKKPAEHALNRFCWSRLRLPQFLDRNIAILVALFDQHDRDVLTDRIFAIAALFRTDQPRVVDQL